MPVFIEWTTESGTPILMPLTSIREIVGCRTGGGANVYTLADDPEVYFSVNTEQLAKLRDALKRPYYSSEDTHIISLD